MLKVTIQYHDTTVPHLHIDTMPDYWIKSLINQLDNEAVAMYFILTMDTLV